MRSAVGQHTGLDHQAARSVPLRDVSRADTRRRPSPWWRLAIADLLVLLSVWSLAGVVIPVGAAIAAAGVCLLAGRHLYADGLVDRRTVELRGVVLVSVHLAAVAAIVGWLTGEVAPAAVAAGSAASLAALVATRVVYGAWLRNARASGRFIRPVVLVGADERASATRRRLEERPELGVAVVVAFGSRHEAQRHGLDDIWAGEAEAVLESPIVRSAQATFVSLAALDRDEIDTIVGGLCHATRGQVHLNSGIPAIDQARLRPANVDYEPVVCVDAPGRGRAQHPAKRLFDLTVGSLALVMALPVVAAAAAAIKLDDRGPVLFRQRRVGRGGRLFTILKLRTMRVGAEAGVANLGSRNERDGPLFKVEHDPRVTRVGSLIRQLSIDELPQLWNVLRGDMSLVGPRPALPEEVEHFDDRLCKRHRVPPGITGLWQVEARNISSFAAYRRLDLFYVDHRSLGLDLAILIGTVESELARVARLVRTHLVLPRRHRRRPAAVASEPAVVRLPESAATVASESAVVRLPESAATVASESAVVRLPESAATVAWEPAAARLPEPGAVPPPALPVRGSAAVPVSAQLARPVSTPALRPGAEPTLVSLSDRSQLVAVAGGCSSAHHDGSRDPAPVTHGTAHPHLRIAMLGTRGVPARYGGFETAVEEIGRRLVERGHDVTVYCRADPAEATRPRHHLGMRLVTLPALHLRSAETLSHSALASLHAVLPRRYDAVFVFNSANAILLPLLRACQLPVAVHVDGLEWRRGKWAGAGARYYRRAEALAVRWADALIADAPGIREYYECEFGADTELLGYGAPVLDDLPDDRLAELAVTRQKFHLVVARFEPENNVELIVRAYRQSTATCPLVVVGSAPYSDTYLETIGTIAASDDRIKLVGSLWDQQQLNQLYGHALLYLHGHSVGGTNPSLLRAMGAGAAVAAYDVRFNRDVLGDDGWFFADDGDVARLVETAERDPTRCGAYGRELQARVAAHHRWDAVTDGYEHLARRLAEGGSRAGQASGRRARPGRRVPVLRPS